MLVVEGLCKSFRTTGGPVAAVHDVSFKVEEGRCYTLLGPSGCGKSTTLRCIAGLERPDGGTVSLEGQVLSGPGSFVPTHARSLGVVFQSYAIWPHMTVFDNVAFPLTVRRPRPSRRQTRQAVQEALALVGLDGLEGRPAPQLSGGQQQRLALARALVRRPRLLLLDEPLSNLDAKLRERMRLELRELQRRLRITTVYVTHDQEEALFLSHRIGVMHTGHLIQEGSPREIYGSPASGFVADFVGAATFVRGRAVALGVEAMGGTVHCSLPESLRPGEEAVLVLRSEDVVLRPEPAGCLNEFAGTIRVAAFLGSHLDCVVAVDEVLVRARAHRSMTLRRGERVWLELPAQHCIALNDDGWTPRALSGDIGDED
jgi:iron(III) transport system ATP-binding protein